MVLSNSYTFVKDIKIGQSAGPITTPLVEGKTVKGEPCVNLCQAETFIPTKDGAALVSRDAEGAWQPVANLKDLQAALANTPKEQLGEKLGIWTDERRFLYLAARDGVAQENEVQSLQSHWDANAVSISEQFNDLGVRTGDPNSAPREMPVGWSFADAHVRASEVGFIQGSYVGKEVGFLNEPRYVDRQETLRVTQFEDQGGDFIPTAVDSIVRTPAGEEPGKADEVDLTYLVYGNAFPVTNVIPV